MDREAQKGGAEMLYIGDSIIGRFDRAGKRVWDHFYAPRRGLNLGIDSDRT